MMINPNRAAPAARVQFQDQPASYFNGTLATIPYQARAVNTPGSGRQVDRISKLRTSVDKGI